MELFRADLHIHSRFSRATARNLNPRVLAAWGRVKGLDVLGTGDFTHPEWREELFDQLIYDKRSGLYRLKDEANLDREIPPLGGFTLPGKTYFMPQAEISSIYKRGGKVRKVHNLVYMPTLEAADAFSKKLDKIGNLNSDGRPILGLDSKDLLEMVLETDPLAFLVPAHIWTPWFSLFGSKSGFDAIEECYGELSSEIFAMETGLSSDPEMNWLISSLDRFRMISNSDAHSAEKLGREANIFKGDISYEGIFRALRGEALGHKFMGTLEFFPEEGKYHLDGHRKCGVVMVPRETEARGGVCPVCGKKLTLGVLHRVLELADREFPEQPAKQPGFVSLIPMHELISEVLGVGPKTKKVSAMYVRLISRFGSELRVLQDAPPDEIAKVSPMLAEGISRMRRGEVIREPGFDGQFGVIKVFTPKERKEYGQGGVLPVSSPTAKKSEEKDDSSDSEQSEPDFAQTPPEPKEPETPPAKMNPAQQHAAQAGPSPVLVVAGPGTGKTFTLTERVAALMDAGENARRILAVTFTRRAADELEERLLKRFNTEGDESISLPRADTLHALAFEYWAQAFTEAPVILTEESAFKTFVEANPDSSRQELRAAWRRISLARERMEELGDDFELFHPYVKAKESWNLADFTDLLEFWLEQIENKIYVCPYTHLLVDEFQDLSTLQLAVVKALLKATGAKGEGLFAIGDPFQAIYGFRGAQPDIASTLHSLWEDLGIAPLEQNYRSAQAILDISAALFQDCDKKPEPLTAKSESKGYVRLFDAPSETTEASWVAERIRWLIGGSSHSLADQGQGSEFDDEDLHASMSPGDVAVLVRFKALIPPFKRVLERLGLPCSVPENEPFWKEPRVASILASAGRFLGVTEDIENLEFTCPDHILAAGPKSLATHLQDLPPFDRMFWQGRAFRELSARFDECGGWAPLLNWVSLEGAMDLASQRSEKIRIMTIHAAKGLEFRAVFLPGLEEGILPFAGPGLLSGKGDGLGDAPPVDEERRLLYVGMTRAKDALFLSSAATRLLYGRELRLAPSSFLKNLPLEQVKRSTLKQHTRRKEKPLSLI